MDDLIVAAQHLGRPPWPTLDPFLFCVHHLDGYPKGDEAMGPAASLSGRNIGSDFAQIDGWNMYHGDRVPGFPRHPHRGFETVTIVRRGYVDHSDSMGATARYGPGDTQWMTAGGGVVHAEMFPLRKRETDNPLELFQIWVNLPKADKMVAPYFTMMWDEQTPRRTFRDADGRETVVTVVAGALDDATPKAPPPNSWAARPESALAIWIVELAPGARWMMPPAPDGTHRTLYTYEGDHTRIGALDTEGRMVVQVRPGRPVPLVGGPQGSKVLMLQARPIGEPVAQYGPFVMNTKAEIQKAFEDYRATGFGGWPWSGDAPVHPRERDRFAVHADGREEAPTA